MKVYLPAWFVNHGLDVMGSDGLVPYKEGVIYFRSVENH